MLVAVVAVAVLLQRQVSRPLARGQIDIDAAAEADHAEPLSCKKLISLARPQQDPPGDEIHQYDGQCAHQDLQVKS